MTIILETCAKVNLYLHVCGRRDDGYHILDSLIVFAQCGDRLTFEVAEDLSLQVTGPMSTHLDGGEEDNLVLKAARGLQALTGTTQGAQIVLEKHLPVAAGIGGGSGDAAAALKGLCQLWKVFPDPLKLEELALSLGADVPICLKGHANHVGGIGETITGLPPLPDCWMVLVNPMIGLSTPAVFKARKGGFSPVAPMVGEYGFEALIAELKARQNDLMTPAISLAPVIEQVLVDLEKQDGCALARMSGSGATCFGLFASEEAAQKAQKSLKKAHEDWWIDQGKII